MTKARIQEAAGLFRAGRLDEAAAIVAPLARGKRASEDALQLMGLIHSRRHEGERAIECFKRAAQVSPRNPRHQYLIGKTLANRGRMEEAVDRYGRALAIDPGFESATIFKAYALEWLGRIDEARELVRGIVEAGRASADLAEVWAKLLIHRGEYEEAARVAGEFAEDGRIEARQRDALLVLVARAKDKLGDYDGAFEAYRKANESRGVTFDVDAYVRLVDEMIETFDASRLGDLARGGVETELPVLIAGMPRSGTTLVEQIIDAHPRAFGDGENADLDKLAAGVCAQLGSDAGYPECLRDAPADAVARLARAHLKAMRSRARKADRIVNKNLRNVLHLGLAWMLMPRMRVIHCVRDPMDTCWSCYTNQLSTLSHGYATDLRALGRVYRENERLMAHWRDVLGVPWLEVRYEEMVEDQEGVSRGIIEFLGLAWDDACLRFHDTGRVVMTLSYDQVRRPMYRSAVGKWRRYDMHLGALKDALGAGW
jgi:tetratricopeptide (TPR) repeat protein